MSANYSTNSSEKVKSNLTEHFFQQLYGADLPGFLVLFTKPSDSVFPYPTTQLQRAAAMCIELAQRENVYFGCCLQERAPTGGRRGGRETTIVLPGLWLDLDIRDGATHKANKLPESVEAVQAFLNSCPWRPTCVVHSGHGVHCWWLFKEAWVFKDAAERERAASLSDRFQDMLRARAKDLHDWEIESTSDLARILRPPGTWNRKGKPVPVRLISDNGPRYDPSDFEPYLPAEPERKSFTAQTTSSGTIPEGTRHTTLTSLAGTMRKRGMTPDAIEAALLEDNRLRCRPPLDEQEVRRIAHDIGAKAAPTVAPPKPPTLIWRDALELQRTPPPAPVALIQDLVYPRTIALVAAPPKVGKTYLVLELGLAVACGRPALGNSLTTIQGKVAYLALEDSVDMIAIKLSQLLTPPPEGSFRVLAGQRIDLLNTTHLDKLIEDLRGFSMIVIDSLRRAHTVDENDNREAALVIDALRELSTETGAAVVAVHHVLKNWDKDADVFTRIRGGGELLAGVDTAIVLDRKRGEEHVGVWAVHRCAKSPDPFCYTWEFVPRKEDAKETVAWTLWRQSIETIRDDARNDKIESKIVEAVRAQQGVGVREIRAACKGVAGIVALEHALEKLVSEGGIIVRVGPHGKKCHYTPDAVPVCPKNQDEK